MTTAFSDGQIQRWANWSFIDYLKIDIGCTISYIMSLCVLLPLVCILQCFKYELSECKTTVLEVLIQIMVDGCLTIGRER